MRYRLGESNVATADRRGAAATMKVLLALRTIRISYHERISRGRRAFIF